MGHRGVEAAQSPVPHCKGEQLTPEFPEAFDPPYSHCSQVNLEHISDSQRRCELHLAKHFLCSGMTGTRAPRCTWWCEVMGLSLRERLSAAGDDCYTPVKSHRAQLLPATAELSCSAQFAVSDVIRHLLNCQNSFL